MSSPKRLSKMHQRINAKVEERAQLGHDNGPREVNTFWDDANSLYVQSIDAIEQTHGQLTQFLKAVVSDPARMALINDPSTLVNNINLLNRDIGEHVDRLNKIHKAHEANVGGTKTPDEHMAVIQVHGQYHDALHVYDTTIMPTVAHIFEQIGAVEELLISEQAARLSAEQAAILDPTVITDVQIKEVKVDHV